MPLFELQGHGPLVIRIGDLEVQQQALGAAPCRQQFFLRVRNRPCLAALGEFTELYQLTQLSPGVAPTLGLKYNPGSAASGGGYFWIAGYSGKESRVAMLSAMASKLEPRPERRIPIRRLGGRKR